MSSVSLEHDGALAIIAFTAPPTNIFSQEVATELRAHVLDVAKSDARALLTRAEGPNFCAGADVNMFVGLDRRAGSGLVTEALSLIGLIENLPIPTIVAIKGICIAAGMELMLAHDIVIAGAGAQIGQIEAMIGTTTLAGGAQRIAARCGVARAKEIVFDARMHSVETLGRWNLVNRVVADDELDAKALAYGKRLAAGPTTALSIGKAAINAAATAMIGAGDVALAAGAPQVFETGDKKRGVEAFLQHGARAFAAGAIAFEGR